MGFANDIIGGAAALIRAAIKSPNYVLGSTGWSINKDGSAEFNNVTVRGTIFGLDFEITTAGLFLYSGTPAFGNLILVLSEASGLDQYGNAYAGPGIAMYDITTGKQIQLRPDLGAILVYS